MRTVTMKNLWGKIVFQWKLWYKTFYETLKTHWALCISTELEEQWCFTGKVLNESSWKQARGVLYPSPWLCCLLHHVLPSLFTSLNTLWNKSHKSIVCKDSSPSPLLLERLPCPPAGCPANCREKLKDPLGHQMRGRFFPDMNFCFPW